MEHGSKTEASAARSLLGSGLYLIVQRSQCTGNIVTYSMYGVLCNVAVIVYIRQPAGSNLLWYCGRLG